MSSKTKKTIHAVNLGIIKYGDTSLIANCYTLEFGLQSYMLKGILSRGKKKTHRSLFEPLTLLAQGCPASHPELMRTVV